MPEQNILTMLQQLHIRVLNAGFGTVDKSWYMCTPPSNFSRLYFICGGEAWIGYGDQKVRLLPDHAYLIPTGLNFTYGCEGTMEHVFFHISVRTQYEFDLFDQLPQVYEFALAPDEVQNLVNRYRAKKVFHLQEAVWGALARFVELPGVQERMHKNYSPLVADALQDIGLHLSAQLRATETAERLHISASNLSKHFRKEVGCTPSQYIDMLLLQKAQDYLMMTDWPVSQIAQQLRYYDPYYFTRFFHRKTGHTPTNFRKIYAGTNWQKK